MKPGTAWVGLGSNLGDSLHMLARAIRALRRQPGIRLTGLSPVYRTSPVGRAGQPQFLNAAVRIRTAMGPDALVKRLLRIERELGRTRARGSKGPRVIDLDLLLWGDEISRTRRVSVPHARLHLRRFAMQPILAVDPRVGHPVLGVSLRRLLSRVPKAQRARRLGTADQRRFRRLLAGGS